MKKTILFSAISLALISLSPVIQAEEEALELEKVTVNANRTEKELAELTNKASVITAEEIEDYSHRNIKDLVRYEPGVIVPGTGRFGLSGFNIRGIGGDRVLTLVDGAPVADEFSFGPNLSARRNFVDVDSLKAVEIVRGPASSLYGSNAIGGLVTFVTKDPSDYFTGDRNHYTSVRLGFDTVDSSLDTSVTYAAGNDRHQGMILATYRDGEETETYFDSDDTTGAARRAANPIDSQDLNVLGKWVFTPNENHRFKFTLEKYKAEAETNALSQAGSVVFGTVKLAVTGDDTRERDRFGFDYQSHVSTMFFDEINLNVYVQGSDTEQKTFEQRLSPAQVQQGRTRDSFYEQDNRGFRLNFIKDVNGTIGQQWVYGVDFDSTKAETLRLGRTFVSATGETLPEFSNFPTRDFPNSRYTSFGFYVQNELSFANDRFLLIPGVRYDKFDLDPKVDEIYLSGNTGSPTPSAYDESEVSAKLGALFNINDQWSLFAQYAEGFKAPPIDAINTGFTNLAGGYTTLPNPDLRPESSQTTELGLRFKGAVHQFEVSAYRNRYDDFIESLAFRGFNPATGLLEFQARNLDKAEIDGFEFRGHWDMSSWVDGLNLQYAYANSDGEDNTTNLPINSVQPESAVVGLGYHSPSGRWGTELILTANKRKTNIDASGIQSSDPDDPAVAPFQTPGFGVVDWVGHYKFNRNVRLNWGVFNLTDKQYWRWNDVLLQADGASNLPRLTQPGTNASVTVKVEF